ncbi:MAG TPA: ABC transporter permease [Candidatus Limnocylindrales bacterium]|nr:ABC transporter permease [Candidatus Limnocylindrales bacterium]
MLGFIARRLLLLIPVAIGVTLFTFFLVRLIPGDPAQNMLGVHATPELLAQLRARLGLDRPLPAQYFIFISQLLHGDLGTSYYFGQPVLSLVAERVTPTIFLLAYSALITTVVSFPAAILAALRRDSFWDQAVRFTFVFGISLPSYWLGIVLILLLAVAVPLFPVGGYGTTFLEHLWYLFLPALTIALGVIPIVLRALRGSLIEVLQADFMDTARSKGLPPHVVLLRHGVRNALLPAITVLAVNVGWLIGGTVIIENVFAIPGLGQLMIFAVSARDYPTVQAVTLVFAVLVVVVYLVADATYFALDPRVRGQLR